MRLSFMAAALGAAAGVAFVDAFDANSNANMAVYYGQNSRNIVGAQGTLASYCQDSTLDIIPLAFLYVFFDSDGLPAINFASACENTYFPGTGLLHCSQMGADIKTCQAAGKKILLSLGGAAGSYGFTSDTQAQTFADTLWNLFGGGTSSTRPFDDAIVDGFDLDIEGGSTTGYTAFVNRMRSHYASDTSKSYYIAAAPQCPLPDAYLNTVLTTAHVDFIFVQFYNNYCGINQYAAGQTTAFNFADWDNFAKVSSYNKNAKVYLGVPAAQSAAGTGYVNIATLGSAAQFLQKTYSSFGGIMMWDCSQAWSNIVSGSINYAQQAKMYLASGAAVVIPTSSKTTTPAATTKVTSTSKALAPTTATLSVPGKVVQSCPAGCVPISYSTTITISPTPTTAAATSSPAAGCPVAGGSCASGAMACNGYYYGQCANGVWVMRKCADGLACFSSGGSVYCDWASNGIITNCGSSASKVKRDTEYGVAFVGGSSGASEISSADTSSAMAGSVEASPVASPLESSTAASNSLDTEVVQSRVVEDFNEPSASTESSSSDAPAAEVYTMETSVAIDAASVSSAAATDGTTATTTVTEATADLVETTLSDDEEYTTETTYPTVTTTDITQVTHVPYSLNSTVSTNTTSNNTSVSGISHLTSSGSTPPTNVSLSIQPLNTTHFLAVLQANTLNNTPILTDWSFSFQSEYQILGTDRGNLTKGSGDLYTITSIPIQEPDRNMAIIVKLWGVYDANTAEGFVGFDGVSAAGSVNGSASLIKRFFRFGSVY